MRITTDESLELPHTKRGWYIVDDNDNIITGPFVWYGDALREKEKLTKNHQG